MSSSLPHPTPPFPSQSSVHPAPFDFSNDRAIVPYANGPGALVTAGHWGQSNEGGKDALLDPSFVAMSRCDGTTQQMRCHWRDHRSRSWHWADLKVLRTRSSTIDIEHCWVFC